MTVEESLHVTFHQSHDYVPSVVR